MFTVPDWQMSTLAVWVVALCNLNLMEKRLPQICKWIHLIFNKAEPVKFFLGQCGQISRRICRMDGSGSPGGIDDHPVF